MTQFPLGPWLNAFSPRGGPMTVSGRSDPQAVAMANSMLRGAGGIPRRPGAVGVPEQLRRGPSRDAAMSALGNNRVIPALPRDMNPMAKQHQEQLYRSYGWREMPERLGWILPGHLNPPGQEKFMGGGMTGYLHGRDLRLRGLQDIAGGRTPLRMRRAPMAGRMPFHRLGSEAGQGESFFGVGAKMAANRRRRQEDYWQRKEEGGNIARRKASQVAGERRQMMDQMTDDEVIVNYGGRRAFAEEIIDPESGIVLEPETMYNPDSWRPVLVSIAGGRQKRKWIRTHAGKQTGKTIRPSKKAPPRSKGAPMSLNLAVNSISVEADRGKMGDFVSSPDATINSKDEDTRKNSRAEAEQIISRISNPKAKTYLKNLIAEHIKRAGD